MNTKALRQKILDLAIHGKLVPQDPNDEPASVLLERIRAEKERLIKEGKIKKPKKSKATCDKPHYPFELPKGWVWCRLEDIASIGTGSTPLTGCKEYYVNGNIPWINSSSTKDALIKTPSNYITSKAIQETNCVVYPKGTLIIAMYGEGKTRGQISELGIDAATNQACAAICPLRKELKNYIKLFFESNYLHIRALAEGGTQPNLNLGKISNYEIPLPPLSEQNRICSEVSYWFDLADTIWNSKEHLQTAIRLTKSKILDLAIHGKLVPQDPNDEPAGKLLKCINPKAEITCDTPQYGKLPKGWCETYLGELFNHNTGKALNSSNTEGTMRDYLTTSNVYWNTFDFSVVKKMLFKDNELEKCSVTKGDLLVCEGGDIGRAAIWNQNYDICIQNHIHRLRPKMNLCVPFYYYTLYYLKVKNMIGGKGIGLLGLSSNALHKIHFPLPPLSEQHRIVAKIEELFAQLDKIEASL